MVDKGYLSPRTSSDTTYIEEFDFDMGETDPLSDKTSQNETYVEKWKLCVCTICFLSLSAVFLFVQYVQMKVVWIYLQGFSKDNAAVICVFLCLLVGLLFIAVLVASVVISSQYGDKGYMRFPALFMLGLIALEVFELFYMAPFWLAIEAILVTLGYSDGGGLGVIEAGLAHGTAQVA